MAEKAATWLALDPGVASGWSLWRRSDCGPIERIGMGVCSGGLAGFIEDHPVLLADVDLVICERFDLDSRTADPNLEPKLVEGALALACAQRGLEIVWQSKATKAMVSDDVLKRLGLWVRGRDVSWTDGRDVNDSEKHALAYAMFENHEATIRWVHPPRAER